MNLKVDEQAVFEFREWLSSLEDTIVGVPGNMYDCPLFWWLWNGRMNKRYLSWLRVHLSHIEYGLRGEEKKVKVEPLPTWARAFQEKAIRIEREITAREALDILDHITKGGMV